MHLSVHYARIEPMEREIIEASVAGLPKSKLGEIQRDHEIWEEYDGGAKIMVTRHVLPTPQKDEIISLSVSGEPTERHRVIKEFIAIYGRPVEVSSYSQNPEELEIIIWLIPKV
ncbi:MAG: hypothetical protein JWO99_340 [Candidatus Saccharibacteria bacterium]|nr:hypothetical protein [Candidatus Saccharibacteria bacterium]